MRLRASSRLIINEHIRKRDSSSNRLNTPKNRSSNRSYFIFQGCLFFSALLVIVFPSLSSAQQPLGPGWYDVKGEPVSVSVAQQYFTKKAIEVSQTLKIQSEPLEAPTGPTGAAAVTSEITGLARGLQYDPKAIYDFVHNYIDYAPYFGSKKGATLTYLDGSGNDFDQASLMIALLRASGYSAQYVFGVMRMSGEALSNWLGVDQERGLISHVLIYGGIPVGPTVNGQTCYTDASCDLSRVWVKVTIGGTDYQLDPAYKAYAYTQKIDIAAALGYDRNSFVSAATSGATITRDYVQNLNEANIRAKLNEYSMNLVSAIRSTHANADVKEIISGRDIQETQLKDYNGNMPFISTPYAYWDEVPAEYSATLRIQHQGIDYTFKVPDLANKRLTLTYPASNSYRPQLKLDGQLIKTGNSTSPGQQLSVTITLDEPYPALNGTYGDQGSTLGVTSGGTFAIINNFGSSSERLARYSRHRIDNYLAQHLSSGSEAVLGESLNLIGLSYVRQCLMEQAVFSSVHDIRTLTHHFFGLVKQTSSYNIDMVLVRSTFNERISQTDSDNDAVRQSSFAPMSAFEHGVIEQMAESGSLGLSTIKVATITNASGEKLYYADSTNFAAIKPVLLQTYPSSDVNSLQSDINAGSVMVIPQKYRNYLGHWTGSAWLQSSATAGIGYWITGGLHGGYGANPGTVDAQYCSAQGNAVPGIQQSPAINVESATAGDPIDIASGAFTRNEENLSLGKGLTMGLQFARTYDSRWKDESRSLGNGWDHNYDIYVTNHTDSDPGLGMRLPVDAAGMIAYAYVSKDVFQNLVGCPWGSCGTYINDSLGWPLMFISAKWAVDQLINNAVTVHTGQQTEEFLVLPDDSYSSPPGSTSTLVKTSGGTFRMDERFGTEWNFDTEKRISSVSDIDGNVLSFAYSGQNLSLVQDAFNRALTFGYDANGRIVSVTDSAGRSVGYSYNSAGDLVNYTDPETKVWTYVYDSNDRLTNLINPKSITELISTYSDLDQVISQTVPRQNSVTVTYQYSYTDRRNAEEDPDGNSTIYRYDSKGRLLSTTDPLGNTTSKKYDGQNHVIEDTDPRGNKTKYFYDSNQNLVSTINALNQQNSVSYDNQFNPTDATDALGHTIHYEYDAKHHLILTQDALGNQSTTTYYPNGFVHTSTDPRGVITAWTYDQYGNPDTRSVGNHPALTMTHDIVGRLTSVTDQAGSTTSMTYDRRSFITSMTDALGKTTTSTYDPTGYLQTRKDRNNVTSSYVYTPLGKMESSNFPDESSASFTYDSRNNLVGAEDAVGHTTYLYDEANRLASFTDAHGLTISYEHDSAGNVISTIYPGGRVVSFEYDSLNRLRSVTTWLGQTAIYTYDDAGRISRLDNFNGSYTLYLYDNANRLTTLENHGFNGEIISSYQYSLDPAGNPQQASTQEPLSAVNGAVQFDYAYNTERNRLLSAGGLSYSYDDEGQFKNVTGAGTTTFRFDAAHRLVGMGTSDFQYDAAGRRLEATRSGQTTRYVYDISGNLIAEATDSNIITRYYVYGRGLLALITPNNHVYCYQFNQVGSTVALTDSNSAVMDSYSYSPFGEMMGQSEVIPQPFSFNGSYGVMHETGNTFLMGRRYYDASLGRFISEDPLGVTADSLNAYAYALNNPVVRIDPSGTTSENPNAWLADSLRGAGEFIENGGKVVAAGIVITTGVVGAVGGASLGPGGAVAGFFLGASLGAAPAAEILVTAEAASLVLNTIALQLDASTRTMYQFTRDFILLGMDKFTNSPLIKIGGFLIKQGDRAFEK